MVSPRLNVVARNDVTALTGSKSFNGMGVKRELYVSYSL